MILLIGHGYWGKFIAKTLGEDLYAVCDSSSSVLSNVSTLYKNTILYSDLDEALDNNSIEAVIIATKASTHFEIAKKAILKGKHVWIEKPACTNLSDIENLILLSQQHNIKVFVDHIMCHDSTINYLKNNFDLAKMKFFESYRLHQGLFQPDTDVVYDLAVHDLSIIDYFFPNIQVVEKSIVRNYHVNDLADHAILNFKFDNGLRATITVSWVSPIKQRQIFMHTDKSMIQIQENKITIKNLDNDLSETYSNNSTIAENIVTVEQIPGLKTAIESFKKMISNGTSITDIYQAKRIQQWIQ